MSPSCLEYDLSKLNLQILGENSERFINTLPCVQSASAGVPLGALNLPPMDQDLSGVIACASDSKLIVDDENAYQLVRRLFIGATAPCFLIVTEDDTVDARMHLARQWAPDEGVQRSNAALRVGRLVTIKSAFGLSNSDMARICRISRPQLYKWLSDDQMLDMTLPNWRRLAQLEQLAKDWNRISGRPLRAFLDTKVDTKNTILDLLSASRLHERAIRDAMNRFASMSRTVPATRDEKMRQAGIKPRRLTGALPWDD